MRESRVVHTMVFQPLNENVINIALQCASDVTAVRGIITRSC
jgi:hypothetical protein